jgi:hypothetical protein
MNMRIIVGERLERANRLIHFVANCGLRRFRHAGMVSRFDIKKDTIWWVEGTVGGEKWLGMVTLNLEFSDGPLMLGFVRALNRYIREGDRFRALLGPFPQWRDGGDPWGYGDNMTLIRERAVELGIYDSL